MKYDESTALSTPYSRTISRARCAMAVSLVELLVVIAILTLILAMLLPSMQSAREQVRRVFCANNLRQWGRALQYYRDDHKNYLPSEGTYLGSGLFQPGTWYNELPSYLGLPAYKDTEGVNELIKEFPALHVWICPSKNRTPAFKSLSGKNQFHYGMNQVLDGIGSVASPSRDAPDFPDEGSQPIRAGRFLGKPNTIYMFDISPNSPAGTPRDVATSYQRDFTGKPVAAFHGDYANLLYLHGGVTSATTEDLVTDKDFRRGNVVWDHPRLYWGYLPPIE
jgi:type II secretory pathway pseudopilin PulG